MSTRKVEVSDYRHRTSDDPADEGVWVLEPVGEALFHGFGTGFLKCASGHVPFSTAIIEYSSGRVEGVELNRIRFLEPMPH